MFTFILTALSVILDRIKILGFGSTQITTKLTTDAYLKKACRCSVNMTEPTSHTFVTVLSSSSCGCGADDTFHKPRRGARSPPPQIERDSASSRNTPHACKLCVWVCGARWGCIMRSGRVQLAMKSSVGRCIQNVWSSMVEMNTRLWGRLWAYVRQRGQNKRTHTCTSSPIAPVSRNTMCLTKRE